MKKIMSLVALAAIFTLSSFVSRAPQGNGPFNSVETMNVEGTVFNECTGEWISYTGTMHANVFGMFRANRVFVNYHIMYNLVGVGETTGRTYRSNTQNQYSESSRSTGAFRMQASTTARWITSGGGNNFTTSTSSEVSVDSRGQVRVSVEEATFSSCQ